MIIYTGRFQPFHNGHLGMVRTLTERFPQETICLAVIKDVPIKQNDEFDNEANIQLNSFRNPFNCVITLRLIEQVLRDEQLFNVIVTLLPRPSIETWNIIANLFDCERTWVFTQNRLAIDNWESKKCGFFQSQGEKTIRIPIEKNIEGAIIRDAIEHKDFALLATVLPEAVLHYIQLCRS